MTSGMTIEEYERITPVATIRLGDVGLRFVTPNRKTVWRAQTMLSKEPCTIEWLDGIEAGELLLDVGANVGVYSVYAALMRQARVHAVEPEAQNFALLCRNVQLNDLQPLVTCWPLALSDERRFDKLFVSDAQAGGSCHSFGEQVNFALQPQRFPLSQGCVSATIDEMVATGAIAPPQHIKVDVDGFEHKVIEGGRATLGGASVRSLIIETNPALEPHQRMIQSLTDIGFSLDQEQIARATRRDGIFKGVAEHVFRRR